MTDASSTISILGHPESCGAFPQTFLGLLPDASGDGTMTENTSSLH